MMACGAVFRGLGPLFYLLNFFWFRKRFARITRIRIEGEGEGFRVWDLGVSVRSLKLGFSEPGRWALHVRLRRLRTWGHMQSESQCGFFGLV